MKDFVFVLRVYCQPNLMGKHNFTVWQLGGEFV